VNILEINIKEKLASYLKEEDNLISLAFQINAEPITDLLDKVSKSNYEYFFSSIPHEKISFLGIDSTIKIRESGNSRVSDTSDFLKDLESKFTSNWDEFNIDYIPLFLGGMKFSPNEDDKLWQDFSDSEWFVPKFLILESETISLLVYNFYNKSMSNENEISADLKLLNELFENPSKKYDEVESRIISSDENDEGKKKHWIQKVNSVLNQIHQGEFQKIVLSREVNVELDKEPNISFYMQQLMELYPKCYIFSFKRNESNFIGASPEKLAKVSNGWLEADALAGSISRGETVTEDEQLANELLNSSKNLFEQKAVVEFICNSLSRFSKNVIYDEFPKIRKLPNIQHLWTQIKAELNTDKDIFTILSEIHPTPAICGVPWNNALANIKKMEDHNRGLFAGIIGWFNFNNEGEFTVSIRSALVKGKQLHAYAGCGIVDGSDAESEFREAELKLRSILSLFKNEEIYQP